MAKLLATLLVAMMVCATMAAPMNARRMLRGGGGGWDGGVQTQDIMSENDAIAGIEEAVSNDQFSSTYSAASNGYRDAYAATFPEDDAGQFWLNNAGQQTAGRHLL